MTVCNPPIYGNFSNHICKKKKSTVIKSAMLQIMLTKNVGESFFLNKANIGITFFVVRLNS